MDFTVLSAPALHAKLREAGYEVPSLRTVYRWVEGTTTPPRAAVEVVRRILEMESKEEPAPPWWAERVLASLLLRESREGVTEAELVEAQIRAAAFLAVARRGPRVRDGGGDGGAANA